MTISIICNFFAKFTNYLKNICIYIFMNSNKCPDVSEFITFCEDITSEDDLYFYCKYQLYFTDDFWFEELYNAFCKTRRLQSNEYKKMCKFVLFETMLDKAIQVHREH